MDRWPGHQDIVMRVRHLDAASAKKNLEEKDVQLERAATFLQEKHQELNNVEAALYRNAENLRRAASTPRSRRCVVSTSSVRMSSQFRR